MVADTTDAPSRPAAEVRRELFRRMVRIRAVEETIAARYAEREMRCPVHLSIGQEAIAVGICAALEPSDYVMSTHRAHAHYLAKGGDLCAMLAEIYGRNTGCCGGRGGSMHLVDLAVNMLGSTPIVGNSLSVGVGVAFGSMMKREPRVTAVFFGEGATEEGVFAECLNFAALKRLPLLFVCENNLYSVYSPLKVRQAPLRDRVAIARAHGIDAARGDGNDVEQVYGMAVRTVQQARQGAGSVFLEFETYRWREHCGPNYDNDIGYRTEAEFLEWRARCPIDAYERRLVAEGILGPKDREAVLAAVRPEIDAAFDYARSSPPPADDQLAAHLFAGAGPR
jgi:pyruvate dehydrogenase E1 component alpha subunit